MKVVGVITEYNPFHYGHQFQLKEIRERSQCDILIVVMSGNVVQRGQFAVLDKWQRTNIALNEGADIVFELPLLASLQAADYFAQESVQLLSKLGCQVFYFGTESATIEQLNHVVEQSEKNQALIDAFFKEEIAKGNSYAFSYQKALEKVLGETVEAMSLPNHQLGIQYLKENKRLLEPMQIGVIKRKTVEDDKLLSASAIRQALAKGSLNQAMIPDSTFEALNQFEVISMEDYWPLLKYQLTSQTSESLSKVFGIKEGFERAILSQVQKAENWHQLTESLVSKRWTRASVNRILLSVLGNIKHAEWQKYQKAYHKQPFVRLLGYRFESSDYLKQLRQAPLTIITNWKKGFEKGYELQLRMDRIFEQNLVKKIDEQNISKYPICLMKKSEE